MAVPFAIRHWLYLPSLLCLDAPLVAAGWALLLQQQTGFPSEALIPTLFFAVWTIYLADRIYDAKRPAPPAPLPMRHRFAAQNLPLLRTLVISSALLAFYCSWQCFTPGLLGAGLPIAACTLGYFLLFRAAPKRNHRGPRLPWKEILIAACFASGVSLAGGGTTWITRIPLEAATLFCLALSNCLLISRAESTFDKGFDPVAFFAGKAAQAASWIGSLLFAAVVLAVLSGGGNSFSLSAIASAVLLLVLFFRSGTRLRSVQAASDAALLTPWLALACKAIA